MEDHAKLMQHEFYMCARCPLGSTIAGSSGAAVCSIAIVACSLQQLYSSIMASKDKAAKDASKEARAGRGKSYQGSAKTVAKIIGEHLKKPKQLQYSQKMNSRIQRDALLPWRDMWRALHGLQDNLSFPQVCLQQALQEVCAEANFFRRSPHHIPGFIKDATERLKVMGRHLGQAKIKGTRWVCEFLDCEPPTSAGSTLPSSGEEDAVDELPHGPGGAEHHDDHDDDDDDNNLPDQAGVDGDLQGCDADGDALPEDEADNDLEPLADGPPASQTEVWAELFGPSAAETQPESISSEADEKDEQDPSKVETQLLHPDEAADAQLPSPGRDQASPGIPLLLFASGLWLESPNLWLGIQKCDHLAPCNPILFFPSPC